MDVRARELAVTALRVHVAAHGELPRVNQPPARSPHRLGVRRLFGNWTNYFTAAGFPRPPYRSWNREEVIACIQAWAAEHRGCRRSEPSGSVTRRAIRTSPPCGGCSGPGAVRSRPRDCHHSRRASDGRTRRCSTPSGGGPTITVLPASADWPASVRLVGPLDGSTVVTVRRFRSIRSVLEQRGEALAGSDPDAEDTVAGSASAWSGCKAQCPEGVR